MRLSLRTLLAFEDNIFDIEQRRQLERTLPVNEAAVNALGRIRNAARHPYLGVPGKVQGQEELDANIVAEYLDQQMPQEHIEKFEDFCFSEDKYLAEVASAHQIVSNVLGEPARISRDCRYRCYQLLPSVPPENKEQKAEIEIIQKIPIREKVPQEKTLPERTLPESAPLEYRKTTPQDIYSPPQAAPQTNPQIKKTDILTGEVIEEPVISMNVWKADNRPEIVKPAAVLKQEDKEYKTERKPAEKNLPLIILTAAVIILSVLCFKLYKDGKHEEIPAHKEIPPVVSALFTDDVPIAETAARSVKQEQENTDVPVADTTVADAPVADFTVANVSVADTPPRLVAVEESREQEIAEDALRFAADSSMALQEKPLQEEPPQDPFFTAAAEVPAIEPVIGKKNEDVKTDMPVCAFSVVNSPVNTVENTAEDTIEKTAENTVKHLPDIVAQNDAPQNIVPQNDVPQDRAVSVNPPINTLESKPVYHFTEHKPSANDKGEFASVQPIISFQPLMKPAETVSAGSIEKQTAAADNGNKLRLQYQQERHLPENKKPEIRTEKQIMITAATELRQPPSAIIQAGSIQAGSTQTESKQTGDTNAADNAALVQKNVVLGRTVETDKNTVLFTAKSADAPWQIETGKIDLDAEQYLLTSSPFRCTFELNGRHHSRLLNGFEIEMLGDSKLCIMPLDKNGTPGIYLDYGRIIIRLKNSGNKNIGEQKLPENVSGKSPKELPEKFSLRIQTEKTAGILSLTGHKSTVFVDTFAEVIEQRNSADEVQPQNAELPPKATPIIGLLPDPQETVSWRMFNKTETVTVMEPFIADRDTSFLLDGANNARGLIQHHPNWIRPVSQPNEAAEIAAVCRRLSEEKNGNCEAVLQSLIQESSVPVRSFGLRLWGDLGRFDIPLTVLSGTKKEGRKEDAKESGNVVPVNRILTSYFREVMKRDEESIQRLSESIQQLRR